MDKFKSKALKDFVAKCECHSAATYTGLKESGELGNQKISGMCHGGLNGGGYNSYPYVSSVLYLKKDGGKWKDHPAVRDYFNWLFNESYVSATFVTKDFDDALVYGAIVKTDTDRNLFQHAFIATRKPNEYINVVLFWWELYRRGVNGDIAFIIAHSTTLKEVRGQQYLLFGRSVADHDNFDWNIMDLPSLRNVVNHTIVAGKGETYAKHGRYDCIQKAFHPDRNKVGGGDKLIDFFKKQLTSMVAQEEVKSSSFSSNNEKMWPLSHACNALAHLIYNYHRENLTFIDEPIEDM